MYGLINRAMEQMVTGAHGEAGWRRVCARAGVAADGFVAMRSYDDAVTYALVEAASVELDKSPASVLEAFGEHWILFTAEAGYSELMRSAGDTLRAFIGQLDVLHGRVESTFQKMRLPTFRVEDVADGEFRLFYGSQRAGLAPMVIGLLRGLARRLGETVEVEHVHAKQRIDEEDIFLVRYRRA